jgi:cell division protein FtsL
MLPLSLGRPSTAFSDARESHNSTAWLRPANIASRHSTELRALIAWLGVFVALSVVVALGHVWVRLKVVDMGYRLVTTRQLIEKIRQEQHELTIEVARLDAPRRLAEVARGRLGMTRPEKGQEAVLP